MSDIVIWAGSGSAISGSTPFAFYDAETDFQTDGPKVANWCAKRLGYPIVEVELRDIHFYACLEEAVGEYSAQVNQFRIRDNMLMLQGAATGSNLSQRVISENLTRIVRLADAYGMEAGVGGDVTWKTGSLSMITGVQNYNMDALWSDVHENGNAIEVRSIWHYQKPAISKYFDPYSGTGLSTMTTEFGWGDYSPSVQFVVMPLWSDLLRMQAIEFNDTIRKSGYSFELRNNQLRIFPLPTSDYTLWFEYMVKADKSVALRDDTVQGQVMADYSNVEFNLMKYNLINQVGRQWIRRYTLALAKEVLGSVRSKYTSIPIPDAEVTMDGSDLRSEAATEKEALISELRETLEQTSKKAQMEMEKETSDNLQETLAKSPLPIYIG